MMKTVNLKLIGLIFVSSVVMLSCNNSGIRDLTGENGEKASGDEMKETPEKNVKAICIYEGGGLYDNRKWISGLNLGETAVYLGETKEDTVQHKKGTYHKIELSDGKIGWANEWVIVLDAYLAVVSDETPVYKRPNVINITDQKMKKFSVIAVQEEKDDFVKFISAGRKNSGWIKKKDITTDDESIAVAVLANRKFKGDPENAEMKELESFIEDFPFDNETLKSYYVDLLEQKQGGVTADEVNDSVSEMTY